MTPANLPGMFVSESEGWNEINRIHPGVTKMLLAVVVPLSLLPPLMYAYANMFHPGQIFPAMEPPLSGGEALLVGGGFFIAELVMVFLMADMIRQIAASHRVIAGFENTFALAAVAPAPLWLASLMMFVPSVWLSVIALAVAWVGSVALIRHGVRPLLHVADRDQARDIASGITIAGVVGWIGLMVVMALMVSAIIGWR